MATVLTKQMSREGVMFLGASKDTHNISVIAERATRLVGRKENFFKNILVKEVANNREKRAETQKTTLKRLERKERSLRARKMLT